MWDQFRPLDSKLRSRIIKLLGEVRRMFYYSFEYFITDECTVIHKQIELIKFKK